MESVRRAFPARSAFWKVEPLFHCLVAQAALERPGL